MAEPAGIGLSTATLGADPTRWQVAPVHEGSGFDDHQIGGVADQIAVHARPVPDGACPETADSEVVAVSGLDEAGWGVGR